MVARTVFRNAPIDLPLARLDAQLGEVIRVLHLIQRFYVGGSERQFSVLARNVRPSRLQLHLGCVSRKGPLGKDFTDIPQFRLGGSLYGWTSLRSRLKLSRYLRENKVQVAHAFDFYVNLTLIPAARLAGVPVVIGSHRQLK